MKTGCLIAFVAFYASGALGNALKSIDFYQEGETSTLKIVLEKEAAALRQHIPQDKQIVLDVMNVTATDRTLRPIDTSEFFGSVVYVSAHRKTPSKKDIRFAIQLRDNVRSKLDVKDNVIFLKIENRFGAFGTLPGRAEVVEKATAEEGNVADDTLQVPKSDAIEDILQNITLAGRKKYVGKKISLNVKEMPVSDLLKIIAETSGFNIIIDDDIKNVKPLTLSLNNIPWDEALDTILSLSNLVANKKGNILSVVTLDKYRKEKEKDAQMKQRTAIQEPLVTRIFPLSFAKIEDMEEIIKEYVTPERGKVSKDVRTNSLIVQDTVDVMERIKRIIEVLDAQTPQILIEAKIVEMEESVDESLGLGSGGLEFTYDPIGDVSGNTKSSAFTFNSAAGASGGSSIFGVTISNLSRLTGLNFNLQLLEAESKARVVSAPKVITKNKIPATLTDTNQTSYLTQPANADSDTPPTYTPITADLELTVTPQVTAEGSVSMEIKVKKEAFRATAEGPPDKVSRDISTNVLVDNGSTVVIGGLYRTETSSGESGVPVLKDLPVLGWLFKRSVFSNTLRQELVIFITPRIINQEEAGLGNRMSTVSTSEVGP